MPRVTSAVFLQRHHFLQDLWNDPALNVLFGFFDYQEQMQLHQYYQPTNDADDDEILLTRSTVNQGDTALAQTSGKVFAKLFIVYADIARRHAGLTVRTLADAQGSLRTVGEAYHRYLSRPQPRSSSSNVRVVAIARPDPDLPAIARALMELAEIQLKEQRKNQSEHQVD